MTCAPPILTLRGISKRYPGVQALSGVDLEVYEGEVHALAGENGAGKSTLMNVMAGVVQPDAGSLLWHGEPFLLDGPAAALRRGIRLIHQELSLVPQLSVAENIFLGAEPARAGFVRRAELHQQSKQVLDRLGLSVDPATTVARLSVGQQQLVEIARALAGQARVIAMDEPTSALSQKEVERLFCTIDGLKQSGVGIIYVSHRLEELQRIADRVTVLRDGQRVVTRRMAELSIAELIRTMVGRPAGEAYPKRSVQPSGPSLLRLEGLWRRGALQPVTLDVAAGEVLGIAGLMGSGRSELLRAIFGADRAHGGRILLDGREVRILAPADAIRAGIVLAPEDRKQQGLFLRMSVRRNLAYGCLSALARFGFMRTRAELEAAEQWTRQLGIRTPSVEQLVGHLSGGNQQKVVLGKWLFARPRVLLLDEPTRGIDVGAKAEIYELINRLAGQGLSVLMVSSELPEVIGMSDRVAVMHEGRLAGVLPVAAASQERIMELATGQAASEGSPA